MATGIQEGDCRRLFLRKPAGCPGDTCWKVLIIISLLLATFLVYGQVIEFDFINYDDDRYVTDNPLVLSGLSSHGTKSAFTKFHVANWHPITMLSHMADVEIYGMNAGGHHFTSVLGHALNTIALFLLLAGTTSAVWPSALVAALFCLHPLHVESVAWISERKDVLSTFFWLLCTGAYVRFVGQPSAGRYLLLLFFFALGLMSKAMVITLPAVLLLLDFWPLGRVGPQWMPTPESSDIPPVQRRSLSYLFLEKAPLAALSIILISATFLAQEKGGAVRSLESFPPGVRIANAAASYLQYLLDMFWPRNLAIFYPHPEEGILSWKAVAAFLFLMVATAAALRLARRFPYIVVGWFWYLITLIPVIGLVQVGLQGHADRYTYVPLIGLFILAAWLLQDLLPEQSVSKGLVIVTVLVLLSLTAAAARSQVRYWRTSSSIFRHAIETVPRNWVAHNNLGIALYDQGRNDEAIAHYRKSLAIRPGFHQANFNLGLALARSGLYQEAAAHYRQALLSDPGNSHLHGSLGEAMAALGRHEEAIEQYQWAILLEPDSAAFRYYLGNAYVSLGKYQEAINSFRATLTIEPDNVLTHNNLGLSLEITGDAVNAEKHLRQALRVDPDSALTLLNLGSLHARQGKLQEAARYFESALEIDPALTEATINLERIRGQLWRQGTVPQGPR